MDQINFEPINFDGLPIFDAVFTPKPEQYYVFENGKVVQPYVDNSTSLRIKREIYQDDYEATAGVIVWSTSYTFNRKTLKLSVSMGMETQKYYCQEITPEEIESILRKQIETLKEE